MNGLIIFFVGFFAGIGLSLYAIITAPDDLD